MALGAWSPLSDAGRARSTTVLLQTDGQHRALAPAQRVIVTDLAGFAAARSCRCSSCEAEDAPLVAKACQCPFCGATPLTVVVKRPRRLLWWLWRCARICPLCRDLHKHLPMFVGDDDALPCRPEEQTSTEALLRRAMVRHITV